MTASGTPLRCKLEIYNKIIQRKMTFKHLGIEMSGYRDVETGVRAQAMKAAKTDAYLNNTLSNN